MDTKQLKEKILELAIRGKLVEQDPTDEPASMLLKKIAKEKQKLIDEKVIKKSKPLPEIMEDEIPFEIPDSWEWVRFSQITICRDGERIPVSLKERESREKIYDYYGASGIIDKIDEFIFDKPLLLIGEDGANLINRTTPIAFIAKGKYWVNNHAHVIDSLNIDTLKYLERYINITDLKPYITGTAQPKFNQANLNNMLIAFPPLSEQRRIVQKIEELFALIDSLEGDRDELLKLVKHTREKVLEEAIRGKLVEQDPSDEPASILLEKIAEEKQRLIDEKVIKKSKPLPEIAEDEIPFEIPESWEWVRLGEVSAINPRNSIEDDKKASFISMSMISDGLRNKHDSEDRLWKDIKSGFTHFAENDVILAKITPCFENRKSAIVRNLINGVGAGTTELYVIRSFGRLILSGYILNIFKMESFIKGGIATYTGTAGQQRVKKEYVVNLPIPLPPLSEQHRIVQKVDSVMELCDVMEEQLLQTK